MEAFGGGVYTYVKDLCNFLVENDVTESLQVHLIYSPNREEFNKDLFIKEINPKIKLYEIDMIRNINISIDYKVLKQTRLILKKIQPDVIHLHSAKATVLGRISAYNIVQKNKIFYSPHGYSFVQQNISSPKKIIFKIIEKTMPLLVGGITVASGDTEYELSKKYGKAVLIRNGVDLELPNNLYKKPHNETLTIGTVGRLCPQKNPSFFNDLALNLPHYKFIWIGNGDLINEITAPNIEVTGWISSREELLKKINQLDIYTQVSLWEGLPISILEAMAIRKPLVVSNVIGNRDTVKNNFNGYTFNSITEAIESFKKLENLTLREKFSENSYLFCDADFNKSKNFLKLLDLYKS